MSTWIRFFRGALVSGVLCGCLPSLAQVPFTEEAVARGVSYTTASASGSFGRGAALVDLDNDGDPDIVLVGTTGGSVGIYENDGTGNFTDRSATSGIAALTAGSGISAADYDDDGDLDIYLSNWFAANMLLRNNGGFHFTDVAVAAGVADTGAAQSGSWGDYDNDGWVDLFLANRAAGVDGENRLYRNLGDGTFLDVLPSLGVTIAGLTFQSIFFDHDLDGDADLYISTDKCGVTSPRNQLYENTGGTYVDISVSSGTDACIDSMGVAVADFDRNGFTDLYPTNTEDGNPLFLNNGDGTYFEESTAAAVQSFATGWGTNFLDFDNDTHQELFVANLLTSNRFYDQDGNWPCTEKAVALGLADTTQFTYGSAMADIDMDGDPDLLVTNNGGPTRMFINNEGQIRNWVKIDVVGPRPNRFAVGALVEITTGGSITQIREVLAGSSFKSQDDLTLHFGTANAIWLNQVQVNWPGGVLTRTLTGYPTSATWTVYPDSMLGDADLDGDVGQDDFSNFMACFTGAVPLSITPGCELMDLESDGDVDTADFDLFLARYSGPLHDCDGNGLPDLRDIAYGTTADLDQNGVPDSCVTLGAAAGSLGSTSLSVADGVSGDLDLSWGGSCFAGDGDYAIYEGSLGNFSSHAIVNCSTLGATSTSVNPLAGDRYWVVVPNNGAREGSYGATSAGERLAAVTPCLPQQTGVCP